MAAISTPSISSTFERIAADYPEISFVRGEDFHWSPDDQTITHPQLRTHADLCQLFHEIGHAKLGHRDYTTDAALIDMERQAWAYAAETLAPRYVVALTLDDAIVQNSLDSYREWLHARSMCPRCDAIGIERSRGSYRCLVCRQNWRVNEARTCRLQRHTK